MASTFGHTWHIGYLLLRHELWLKATAVAVLPSLTVLDVGWAQLEFLISGSFVESDGGWAGVTHMSAHQWWLSAGPSARLLG